MNVAMYFKKIREKAKRNQARHIMVLPGKKTLE